MVSLCRLRRNVGIRNWTRWLREDLSSRPYVLASARFCSSFSLLSC